MLETFQELLKDDELTIDDELRSRGFDSLQAVAGAMLVRKLGIKLTPQDILKYETIRTISESVHAEIDTSTSEEAKFETEKIFSMTPTQLDWNEAGFREHYNIYGAWHYNSSELDTKAFSTAVQLLVESQEELRLRISNIDGQLKFRTEPAEPGLFLETIDFSNLGIKEAIEKATSYCRDLQRAFKFDGTMRLCKFSNIKLSENGDGWIFIIVHHFTVDGFGWGNLLRKLSHYYECAISNADVTDIYGGSGMAERWSDALNRYGHQAPEEDLNYWRNLPWEKLNKPLLASRYTTEPVREDDWFTDHYAEKLHEMQYMDSISEEEACSIFEKQATVVKYLDEDITTTLLSRKWSGSNDDKFDDFDVFSTAAAMALSPYNQTDLLWIDMLAATRSGIFPEIDASGSLGYFSELTPFVVPIDKDTEFRERAKAVSRFRSTQPLSGVGLRAIKFCNIERSSSKLLETMSLPQVGINYHASLLYNFNGTMLDLKPVSEWLGPTLDENGIRYRFWFRVSYVGKKLEIVLRYDPRHYTVDDGYQVAGSTIDSLRSFLSC